MEDSLFLASNREHSGEIHFCCEHVSQLLYCFFFLIFNLSNYFYISYLFIMHLAHEISLRLLYQTQPHNNCLESTFIITPVLWRSKVLLMKEYANKRIITVNCSIRFMQKFDSIFITPTLSSQSVPVSRYRHLFSKRFIYKLFTCIRCFEYCFKLTYWFFIYWFKVLYCRWKKNKYCI